MVHFTRDSAAPSYEMIPPLVQKLVTALERNPYVSGHTVWLETQHGHVILRGIVRSYFQKQMAQEAVRRVDGVERISNELEVAAY